MIILARHGETDGNAKRVMQTPETPLSAAGFDQAARLAERIALLGPLRILCSDLLRARATAQAIVQRTGAPIEFTPLLQERNFGALRGTPYAELKSDPFAPDFVPPEGESWPDFHARVERAFELILARRQAQGINLVVVTHGLVCAALVQRHFPLEPGLTIPARFDNTSVTLVDGLPPYRTRLINCCAHLDAARPSAEGPA